MRLEWGRKSEAAEEAEREERSLKLHRPKLSSARLAK